MSRAMIYFQFAFVFLSLLSSDCVYINSACNYSKSCLIEYYIIYTVLSLPQFFNQVLVMGKSSVSDLSEHVFDLIQELFAIDPMLLTSVMPQLEFKLKVNTTRTLPQKQ